MAKLDLKVGDYVKLTGTHWSMFGRNERNKIVRVDSFEGAQAWNDEKDDNGQFIYGSLTQPDGNTYDGYAVEKVEGPDILIPETPTIEIFDKSVGTASVSWYKNGKVALHVPNEIYTAQQLDDLITVLQYARMEAYGNDT